MASVFFLIAAFLAFTSSSLMRVTRAEWIADNDGLRSVAQLRSDGSDISPPTVTDSGAGLSVECVEAFKQLEVNNMTSVLTAMIDAWGKPGPGILSGDLYWFGDYLQCTSMSHSKYCVSTFDITTGKSVLPIHLGLCLPKNCSDADGFNFPRYFENVTESPSMRQALAVLSGYIDEYTSNYSGWCSAPLTHTTGSVISFGLVGIIVSLLLTGTFVDWYFFNDLPAQASDTGRGSFNVNVTKIERNSPFNGFGGVEPSSGNAITRRTASPGNGRDAVHERSPLLAIPSRPAEYQGPRHVRRWLEVLRCFSVPRKLTIILAAKHKTGTIPSLHGLRVFSMFWVILGHGYIWAMIVGESNAIYALQITKRVSFQLVVNGTFSVDTFFFLSGLLVMFLTLKYLEKNGRVRWHAFYLHRYLRLTPLYMFVILASIYIVPYFGSGPMWVPVMVESTAACKKYWWTNMLYIQNFYPVSMTDGCLDWGWYMANDMQFFIISPLVIMAAYKLRALGAAVSCGVLVAVSIVTRAVLTDHYKMHMDGNFKNQLMTSGLPNNVETIVYEKPYTRIATYAIGMAVGYMLPRAQQQFTSRSYGTRVVMSITGWLLTALFLCLPVFSLSGIYATQTQLSLAGSVAYETLARISWGLGLACLVLLCHSGYGGYVNSILSHPMWIPLSRLTFGAYLVHPIVLDIIYVSLDNAVYFTDAAVVFHYVAAVTVSYLTSLVCAVGIEYPLLELESKFLGSR